MIGETLGQYRIDARLGAGGMGVVYRAHDERLHRIVALKLIGAGGRGSTPDERSRLLDEARAASHLSHPHICTVYEVGEIQGRAFIAMEFVEGLPLSQVVPPDGLTPETVVRYGIQIAGALSHAHERGVIHRDLKTANVAINPESGAKILDFGLARRNGAPGVDVNTGSIELTEPGMLVGTLAYVAPELLLGQGADARSDIWSLGVLLYEIATGQLPFQGRNEFDLTAAILRSPPLVFPAHVPPVLRAIILNCLAKEPPQRYQRAGEVRAALDAIHSDLVVAPAIETVPKRPARARPPRWMLLAGAGAIAAAALVGALMLRNRGASWEEVQSGRKLTRVPSTEERTFDPAISPDGRMLAFMVEKPLGHVDLFTGRVSGGAWIRLTTDAAREVSARFAPDGERIAYTVTDTTSGVPSVRVVPTNGGDVIATIPDAADAAWSPDGRRIAYLHRSADREGVELTVSSVDGSDARAILASDSKYPFLRHPAWSPDGRTIAIVRGTGGVAGEIWLVPSEGGNPRLAIQEPTATYSDWPSFTADGRGIVHASNRGGATNIWLLPLSGGAPIRLTTGSGPDESPTVANDGTIAFANSRWRNRLDVHDLKTGSFRTLLTHSPYLWGPAVSPNGREIAFSRGEVDGTWHLWSVGVDGGAARQVTSGESGEVYGRYSPDGSTLWFHTWNAPRRIGRVPVTGGRATPVSFGEGPSEGFADVSPNGKMVAFVRVEPDAERIYLAPVEGGPARKLTSSRGTVPKWSPDGLSIAFATERGYGGNIMVIGADGTGERVIATGGGWPVWWPDGRQLGFLAVSRSRNQEIRIVPLSGGTSRVIESIRLTGTNLPFAVFPDGQRLVVPNAVHVSDEIWLIEPKR
jgi:Tol biopolymer transport system component